MKRVANQYELVLHCTWNDILSRLRVWSSAVLGYIYYY